MAKITFTVRINAPVEQVFKFLTQPSNTQLVYPKEMALKLLSAPEKLEQDSQLTYQTKLLGQSFTWRSKMRSLTAPYEFTDEAVESPLKKWVHRHKLKSISGRTLLEEEVEYSTGLGPVGDLFAKQMITRIMEYRHTALRKVFGEQSEPVFRDPFNIDLRLGTALSLLATIIGVILTFSLPIGNELLVIILGSAAWILLWFFTHDLAHLVIGSITGVRFSHYFIGLSNMIRLRNIIPSSLRLGVIALGLRIDRTRSRAGKKGFAAMYIAGPLTSMLAPFSVPIWILLQDGASLAGLVLLVISLLNLGFTLYFSPKAGCIYKARKLSTAKR
ncbi:MAG: SRPBCC family protein [Thaumarchaeota archaeon]|nr:SRPBCC family protein [Nitrososphaerota archaeon]